MDKQIFLSKYDLVESDLIEADITWEELVLIEEEYKGHENKLREIDHDIVYKETKDDEMLRDYSKLLNRLSGLADEMSSYFRRMKQEREN